MDISPFQKESFCLPKRVLLHPKRSPFALQNDSFCNPKGVLLRNASIFFAIHLDFLCESPRFSLSKCLNILGLQPLPFCQSGPLLLAQAFHQFCCFARPDDSRKHLERSLTYSFQALELAEQLLARGRTDARYVIEGAVKGVF